MLQLLSSSIPGTYSTKIWMSTELAENRDLGPLGHPHHRSVLGFCRHFITHLKVAQGLRGLQSGFTRLGEIAGARAWDSRNLGTIL